MHPNPEFADNPDPRCACVLLLDTSGSMSGAPINALNQGLLTFEKDLQTDALASRRVEIAIFSFGGSVQKVQDFVSAGNFKAPTLTASGGTPMGEGIIQAVNAVNLRKQEYKHNGVLYYQPWVFMITDGAPTDQWQHAASIVQKHVSDRKLSFFAVAVNNADEAVLKQITNRVSKLDGLRFNELFTWLSKSQQSVSASRPGQQTPLPPASGGFLAPVG